MKKIKNLIIYLMFILLIMNVNGEEYFEIKGDSIFVSGINWQKIESTDSDYYAFVTADLNYNQIMNPLGRYAVVEQYNYSNWWLDYLQFDDIGTISYYIDENGEQQSYERLMYYYELPDISEGSDADLYECEVHGRCGEIAPQTRAGYYGLPFYIEELNFLCDINDKNKGGYSVKPDVSDYDTYTLTHLDWEGLSTPLLTIETSVAPLGWKTYPTQVVRYNNIPVRCFDMETTANSRLSFTLRPNPLYRHIHPDLPNSETWVFSDIISSLPSLSNNANLPFNLNIAFNFSGNFWDYNVSNADILEEMDSSNYANLDTDLICEIEFEHFTLQEKLTASTDSIMVVRYSELTSEQKKIINTGQGITCVFPHDTSLDTLNNKGMNDIINAISFQQQKEIVLQYDLLNNNLKLKQFVTNTILPFFVMITIIVFYLIELLLLAITIFGILPMMFKQFYKGLKDAYSVDDLIAKHNSKRGGKK